MALQIAGIILEKLQQKKYLYNMKKRTGKIQVIVNSTGTIRELNICYNFKGVIKLCIEVWKAYRRRADKIYIFFDK